MGNIEYERLVAVYDADTQPLKTKSDEVLKICDALEGRFKSLKIGFGAGGAGSRDSVIKDARAMLKIQTDVARAEKAAEQQKRATIAAATEQIKQEREREKLARETGNRTKQANASEQQARKGTINLLIQETRLERERLKLAEQIARQNRRQPPAPNKRTPSGDSSIVGNFGSELFTTVLGASTMGGLAVNAVTGILSGIKSGIAAGLDQAVAAGVTAADYERTKIAIAGVIGGAAQANAAIAQLEKTASQTPGLTFKNALDGYQRLRAVQFGARDAERALVGLSKVKILSGGTEDDWQAVLINFAQIRSVGKLTGDELRETLGRFPYFAQILQNAFGTISTEKIGELQLSSEEFFERIFAEMEKMPTVAGGVNESWDRLTDQFYKSQIAFGEPLLEPVSESLQLLTDFLKENKDTWTDWGQYVGDTIRGVNNVAKEIKNPQSQTKLEREADEGRAGQRQVLYDAYNYLFTPRSAEKNEYGLAAKGAEIRERKLKDDKNKKPPGNPFEAFKATADVFKQMDVFRKSGQDDEVRLYREKVKEIGTLQATRLTESENFYTRQRALIIGAVRRTTGDELNYLKQAGTIEKAESANRLAMLEGGINKTRALNEKLIASYLPQDQGKIRAVKERELAQQIAELDKEKAKAQFDEANRARQILEAENRVFDERRKADIEYRTLIIQQTRDTAESQALAVQKGLDNQTVSVEKGYADLLAVTRQSQEKISATNREQLNLQLQDASLTSEQRRNIIAQAYLDEQRAAEENSRAIKEIEKRRTAALIEEVVQRTDAQTRFIQNAQNVSSGFSFFGNVDEVGSVANFGKLLEKAKDLKSFFDKSNESQSKYFKDQSEHYRRLAAQTKDVLERLKQTKEAMIPDAPPVTAVPSPDGSVFMPPVDAQPFPAVAAAATKKDERVTKIDTEISDAQSKLTQYTGIASKFAQIAIQFNGLAQDIEKSYGTLQVDIFGLYDSLDQGLSDYTVFDQIIEKSYLAQRALDGSALAAKVQGLTLQLGVAERGFEEGTVAPADVAKIKTDLLEAEQAQKAFNFETDIGKEKLDSLTRSAELFKKLVSGDKVAVGTALFNANLSLNNEKNNLAAQNIALEKKFYEDSELWAERRKNTLLEYEREIFEARKQRENEESIPIGQRLALQQAQQPSYVEMLKNDIAGFPNSMASMLAGVAQQWDGTWRGLFSAVKQGFAEMLADMAQQYLKAAIGKLIGGLVGSLLGVFGGAIGSAFGGGFATFGGAGANHGIGDFAEGGLIRGAGTATSDSIPANLSNGEFVQRAKAVDYYGVDFMNALNNLQIPKRGYSTGGYVSDSTGNGAATYDIPVIPKAETFNKAMKDSAAGDRNGSGKTVTNNFTVNQVFKTPRALTAPKSTRQQASAAVGGMMRGSRNYD